MNGNAASDLVLALVCGWVVMTRFARQPGFGLAALLIGVAAALGVLRFTGLEMVTGAHRFASLVSACAGFPLLAWAVRWPADPIAATRAGASRAALLAGGIGVGATVFGLEAWGQIVAVLSALVIAVTAMQQRESAAIAGATALIIGMAAAAIGKAAPFNTTVVLHLGLAAALVLLVVASERRMTAR
ncbi:MAG: hypothetical protein H7268_13095 [Sandarakinorhabdus sp.]|nr:hypothetical protein [Sandarakinorhabdus sp.]